MEETCEHYIQLILDKLIHIKSAKLLNRIYVFICILMED